jgi:hypothetical protein
MEVFSEWRRDFSEESQVGLPSPVSRRRRVGPWPIRYVFVPVFWGQFRLLFGLDGMLVFCDTLESELVIIVSFAESQRSFVGNVWFLTFPGLPPSILITLELIRSISGKCTRLDAMFR